MFRKGALGYKAQQIPQRNILIPFQMTTGAARYSSCYYLI
jgi:hypothetical protein